MPTANSPTYAHLEYWTAEVDDLVGGFIVTNSKKPASETCVPAPSTKDSAYCRCGTLLSRHPKNYIIAMIIPTERDAILIAAGLNRAGVRPCS